MRERRCIDLMQSGQHGEVRALERRSEESLDQRDQMRMLSIPFMAEARALAVSFSFGTRTSWI